MRAWLPDPAALARIRRCVVSVPTADSDQLVIAVEAFSINRGETFLLERPPVGWRPGKDVAGTVLAVGSAVTDVCVGHRVVAHPGQGGWAEQVAVEAERVALLPDAVDFRTAAALPLAGLTALRLTRVTGPLAAREVLLTGASGGVGHAFVQLAAAHGAIVTAVCAESARGARLLELGAAEVVADVREADGPFDIALESTGGEAMGIAWARLRQRGRLVWFGQAGRKPAQMDFLDWSGATSGSLRRFDYAEDDTSVGTDLAALVRLVASARLQIEIGLIADWAQTPDAIEALLARRVRGNAVLTLSPNGHAP